jgi:exopolysaccharide production protein ExoZ
MERVGQPAKLHSVQALRGTAVLLVVWVHMSAPHGFEARYLGGQRLTRWMHYPTIISVDLFFIISGVMITATAWPLFGKTGAWRAFAFRRVTRIYPLYLIVTGLILIVFLIRPGLVNSHDVHRPEVVPSLLLLPQPGDPLLAVGWTLVYELYFYIIFTVAMLFARRWLPWILGGWAAATILLHAAFAPTRNPYLYVATNLTNLEFVFGCLIGFLVVHRVIVKPRLLLVLSVSALAAVLAYLMATDPATFPSQWFQVGLVAGPMAIALYALVGLELHRGVSIPRWLERTGDGSYSIYLWHVPILAVIGLVVEHINTSPLVPHIAALLLVFAITIAAGMWLYGLIERRLLRAFRARVFSLPTAEKRGNRVPQRI